MSKYSKIPTSNISASNRNATITASTPLESKKLPTNIRVEPNKLKFSDSAEFSIIEKTPEPVSMSVLPLKQMENVPLKRSATTLHPFPKKQARVVSKSSTTTVKIPPYDFKAKYNDLLEKHQSLKSENSLLLENCSMHIEELQNVKSSFKIVKVENSTISRKLGDYASENIKYVINIEELKDEKEACNKTISELKYLLKEKDDRFKTFNDEMSSQLADVNKQLTLKSSEYDTLKTILDDEIKKSFHFKSDNEEQCKKIINITGELTCLKMKLNIFEEKNNENAALIFDLKNENEKLKENISNTTDKNNHLSSSLESKKNDYVKMSDLYESQTEKCFKLNQELDICQTNAAKYCNDLVDEKKCNELLRMKNHEHEKHVEILIKQNEELQRKIETMYENEKILRNEIQDLKGHIRVFCRIRPPLMDESNKPLLQVDLLDSASMEIEKTLINSTIGLAKKQNFKHAFTFDGIFSSNANQIEIFEEVSTLIQSALDGFNVCIFAYGQTGSGKTYTMEGDLNSDKLGIIPRAIEMIFAKIPELNAVGWKFTITASFLEIYNENIFDLLDSNKDQEDHAIKMADAKGTDVYVSNLKEEIVSNSNDLSRLLNISQKNRKTAATICNERSSRSHSITKIKFNAIHEMRKEKYTSYLNLVDLAGSESGKTTQRMDETKSINKSLSELSKVILALQSKQSHVPYRNSKLTHLLMPSLGGNSKTLMLVNVSQLDDCYQETMNSLRFAAKVNSCKNGVSKKNISSL